MLAIRPHSPSQSEQKSLDYTPNKAKRLLAQTASCKAMVPHTNLYSLQAPEVECTSKLQVLQP
jgi:hypothetical protein